MKARRTYKKTLENAIESYGEGERARRTAFSSLKHSFEKVGDHWEPKSEKGPSDERAAKQGKEARQGKGKTYGGVDINGRSKHELIDLARRLDITGRSSMNKEQLADAINKANKRATAKARS